METYLDECLGGRAGCHVSMFSCVYAFCLFVSFFVLFITVKDLLSHVDVCQVEILFITIAILVSALVDG